MVEIPQGPIRPEIQAFAPVKGRLMAIMMGEIAGLCSVFAELGCCFGIVKFVTEFPSNKIYYLSLVAYLNGNFSTIAQLCRTYFLYGSENG